MGILPGPLTTSPSQTALPSEVIRVLGKVALESATAYVHIRSGLDSLLGDTHLVVIGGKLHVVARKSSLDPLLDVSIEALPEIDEEGYRSVLQLRTVEGDKRVEIGATEENAVHALVAGLSIQQLEVPAPVAEAPFPAGEGAASPGAPAADGWGIGDVETARAAFLDLLATRRAQRKAKLRSDRVTHQRATRSGKPAAAASRPSAATLRAELGTATTDEDGDGVPDPPGERASPARRPEPAPQSSLLGLAVLTLLLLVGFLAVVSRLLAEAR